MHRPVQTQSDLNTHATRQIEHIISTHSRKRNDRLTLARTTAEEEDGGGGGGGGGGCQHVKCEFYKHWRFAAEKRKKEKKVARAEGENGG